MLKNVKSVRLQAEFAAATAALQVAIPSIPGFMRIHLSIAVPFSISHESPHPVNKNMTEVVMKKKLLYDMI